MELSIKDVLDNEDGTFSLTLDMDDESMAFLIQYALTDILKKRLEEDDDTTR